MSLSRRNNPQKVKAGCGQNYSKTLLGTRNNYTLDCSAFSMWRWSSTFSEGLKRGLEMNILLKQWLNTCYLHDLDQVA